MRHLTSSTTLGCQKRRVNRNCALIMNRYTNATSSAETLARWVVGWLERPIEAASCSVLTARVDEIGTKRAAKLLMSGVRGRDVEPEEFISLICWYLDWSYNMNAHDNSRYGSSGPSSIHLSYMMQMFPSIARNCKFPWRLFVDCHFPITFF